MNEIDDATMAELLRRCDELGNRRLSTNELSNERGEWTDAFDPYFDIIDSALIPGGIDESAGDWRARQAALRRLALEHLVPKIETHGVTVRVGYQYKNPVRAVVVNGLWRNERELPYEEVVVTGAQIGGAYLAELRGEPDPPTQPSTRASVMDEGLAAFVGRRVEVIVSADEDENIAGRLAAVRSESVVIARSDSWGGDAVIVIPLGSVRGVASYDLTDDEIVLFE